MIRHFVIIFMLLLGATISSIAFGSKTSECTQLFPAAEVKAHKGYHGIVLTYSPVLLINGTVRRFSDHVMIEAFNPGAGAAKARTLVPYYHYSGLSQPYGREQLHHAGP